MQSDVSKYTFKSSRWTFFNSLNELLEHVHWIGNGGLAELLLQYDLEKIPRSSSEFFLKTQAELANFPNFYAKFP